MIYIILYANKINRKRKIRLFRRKVYKNLENFSSTNEIYYSLINFQLETNKLF